MGRRERPEFDPTAPITVTPATHPSLSEGATLAKVAAIEVVGVGIDHAFHWAWWVGAQLPVAYLFWRLMHERAWYTGVVVAWNRRLGSVGNPVASDTVSLDRADRFGKAKDESDGKG